MTCAVIAYVPPRGILHSDAFMENIRAWDAGLPLYLLSDDPNWQVTACPNPEIMKVPGSRFRIANIIFLLALKLAIAKELSHFLFVESDSRVRGDNWALLLWREFLSYPGCLVGGTPALYNISKINNVTPRKTVEFVNDTFRASGTVVSVYGLQPSVAAFINGSLAIYDTQVCYSIFKTLGLDDDIVACARTNSPFDVTIGRALSNRFGIRMLDLLAVSSLSYSSVDRIYDEQARIKMLTSGEKVAVHPFKGDWNGA